MSAIYEALGREDTIRFLRHFGGTDLSVPERPSERSRLVRVMGMDNAMALARVRDRMRKEVPLGKPWIAACMHAEGASMREICLALFATRVTVHAWLRKETERLKRLETECKTRAN